MKEEILSQYTLGNVVYMTIDGPRSLPMARFISQDAEGILYDLSRLEEETLSDTEDPRWVNDYAVAKTIRALKAKIDELEGKAGG